MAMTSFQRLLRKYDWQEPRSNIRETSDLAAMMEGFDEDDVLNLAVQWRVAEVEIDDLELSLVDPAAASVEIHPSDIPRWGQIREWVTAEYAGDLPEALRTSPVIICGIPLGHPWKFGSWEFIDGWHRCCLAKFEYGLTHVTVLAGLQAEHLTFVGRSDVSEVSNQGDAAGGEQPAG